MCVQSPVQYKKVNAPHSTIYLYCTHRHWGRMDGSMAENKQWYWFKFSAL